MQRGETILPTIRTDAKIVTFINVFTVDPTKIDEF
jgi:hypothetical protein